MSPRQEKLRDWRRNDRPGRPRAARAVEAVAAAGSRRFSPGDLAVTLADRWSVADDQQRGQRLVRRGARVRVERVGKTVPTARVVVVETGEALVISERMLERVES